MTRKDLIKQYAKKAAITYDKADAQFKAVIEVIVDNITTKPKVDIRGLGVFKQKTSNARVGRNPKTGAEVQIPEKQKIAFKVSNTLRKAINTK